MKFERLPKNVVPSHYDIVLRPDMDNFSIQGTETVKIEIVEPTDVIVLNISEMDVQKAEFRSVSGEVQLKARIETSLQLELLMLHFPQLLPVGQAELSIRFIAVLNNRLKGLYRSKYTSITGETRYSAVSQFEPTDARRAFPCWDEPAIKATFDITLIVPKNRTALSNSNILEDIPCADDENCRTVRYATTPKMSTYLVAFVVGEYDYEESYSKDGVAVRVYTPVGKKEHGQFALEVAAKVLPYYKDYFNVAYPLEKLDLIAISDFAAGAMENWGLVTYRENCLLLDPMQSSAEQKQHVALVVGHELAHQWFGNLVTMEWWTHLWLNEGFATWIEFLCVDFLFPEYNIWTQFVNDTMIRALELDALDNSHPIEVPVGHPSEVDEIFDDISYCKGASVIRMLHSYIGDKDFRKGMNQYLTKHQYKNTFTEDLWAALGQASGKPINDVMSTWTKQMGFPLIKVSSRREGMSLVLTLTQDKFNADLQDGSESDSGYQWMVPISVCTARHPEKIVENFLLDSKTAEVTIDDVLEDDWVKINPGMVGYYRTQYPADMLKKFLPAICDQSMPPLDRLGLLDDTFNLVKSGQAPTVEALELMGSFVNEDNYVVWKCLINCLGRLNQLLSQTHFHGHYQEFGRKLLSKIMGKLGWDPKPDESHMDTLLRGMVIRRLGAFHDENVQLEAKKRFDAHANGSSILPADLRTPVYQTVMAAGDEAAYEVMLKLYRETDTNEEKDRLSRAMGALPQKYLLEKVLQFAMSDEVKTQDTVFVIISVAINKNGRDLAWEFFKENFKAITSRFEGGHLLSLLVKYCTENFATEEKASEVEKFFEANKVPTAERKIQQSVESIRLNTKWLQRDEDSIEQWLKKTSH